MNYISSSRWSLLVVPVLFATALLLASVVQCAVPPRVNNVRSTNITASMIQVQWDPCEGATGYEFYYAVVGGNQTVVTTTQTSYTLENLAPGTSYSVMVAGTNGEGTGTPSSAVIFITSTAAPSAPQNLAVSSKTSHSLSLAWKAPSFIGGTPITNYRVTYTPPGGSPQVKYTGNSETTFGLTGLLGSSQYTITVAAVNNAGVSSESNSVTDTTLAPTPPDAPIGLSASASTWTSVSLSWTAPVVLGGAPILEYVVTCTPAGGSAATTISAAANHTSLTVTSLSSGAKYSFVVAARNSAGTSSPSNTVDKATAPAAPSNLTAGAITPSSISLTWASPSPNTLPISNYRITFSRQQGQGQAEQQHIDTGNSNTSYTILGLDGNQVYTIKVAAQNEAGVGDQSTSISVTTRTAVVPSAPSGLTFSNVLTNSVDLSWQQPTSDGGSGISKYQVSYSRQGGATEFTFITSAATTFTLNGLIANSQYLVSVGAVNSVGTGPYSNQVNFTTALSSVSTPPTNVRAQFVTAAGINLLWDAPLSNGGTPITGYWIEYAAGNASFSLDTSPSVTRNQTITGLARLTEYRIAVSAINANGKSNTSAPILVSTTADIPKAPANLTVAARTATKITLLWVAPLDQGGAPITEYEIYYGSGQGSTTTVSTLSANTTFTLTGLSASTSYFITVAALNSAGSGDPSTTVTTSTLAPTAPDAPTGLASSNPGMTSVDLQWIRPSDDGGARITSYVVKYTLGAVSQTTVSNGNATAFTLSNLLADTEYNVSVASVNSVGTGPHSQIITVRTTAGVPGAPNGVTVSNITHNSITVSWTAPSRDSGSPIIQYRIKYIVGSSGAAALVGASTTTYTIKSLQPSTLYNITVAAQNANGFGQESDSVAAATRPVSAPTSAPTNLSTRNVSATSMVVSWTAPNDDGGDAIISYELSITFSNGKTVIKRTENAQTEFTVTGLAPGSTYIITVLAINSIGASAPSSPNQVSTLPASVPGVPTQVRAQASAGGPKSTVYVSWQAPVNDGGSPILSYRVKLARGASSTPQYNETSETRSIRITGLQPDTRYTITVAAKNAAGYSAESSSVTYSFMEEQNDDSQQDGATSMAAALKRPLSLSLLHVSTGVAVTMAWLLQIFLH